MICTCEASLEIPAAVKLCYYAHIGNLDKVKELIESRTVGVNDVDYTERTALHAAAAAGHADIVQYLVERGADRTIQDSWGITPVGTYVHLVPRALFNDVWSSFICLDSALRALTDFRSMLVLVHSLPLAPIIMTATNLCVFFRSMVRR